ncbi:class I SAM-dependent methyltransferase [Kribbella ginsengisoli]|uniref:Class I SAM-dependent methyltransferase n=1 Tax=Kribbella ginsengisoli TaxID=363865 RepID=A0ABP6YH55_9ACTN
MTTDERVGQGGTGPGELAPDGSSVDLYVQVQPHGEDELINAAIAPGSSILELGCGTGRITRPLVAFGHQVVAVDESAAMTSRITEAETVVSTIEELRLDRRFDVVLMMSYLINVADDGARQRLLDTCAHHVKSDGVVLLQQQDREVFARNVVRESPQRRVEVADVKQLPDDMQSATMIYTVDGRTWSQHVLVKNLTEETLSAALHASGLALDGYLTPDRGWIRAKLR